jgi:uncharacterized protein YndB with AHSA1/START domain
MSENGVQMGRISRLGDTFEARLERFFDHDRDAVWHMITRSEALVQWLAPGTIEPRVGGAVHIDFADSGITIESTVLELAPLRLLEYSWSSGDEPARPLRWELEPGGEGTRLALILRLPGTEDVSKACAGFDAHLEMLAAALEGVPIRFPLDYYLERRRVYQSLQPE